MLLYTTYSMKRKITYHDTLTHSFIHTQTNTHTHLQVKELAVASVNDFRAAIAPGHFNDVNLERQNTKIIGTFKQTNNHYC